MPRTNRALVSFDPEIEKTARALRKQKRLEQIQKLPDFDLEYIFSEESDSKPVAMGDDNNEKPLRDYAMPNASGAPSSIVRPTISANNFELRPALIQIIQQDQFSGLDNEDPNEHITTFLEKCDTVKLNGVTDDILEIVMRLCDNQDESLMHVTCSVACCCHFLLVCAALTCYCYVLPLPSTTCCCYVLLFAAAQELPALYTRVARGIEPNNKAVAQEIASLEVVLLQFPRVDVGVCQTPVFTGVAPHDATGTTLLNPGLNAMDLDVQEEVKSNFSLVNNKEDEIMANQDTKWEEEVPSDCSQCTGPRSAQNIRKIPFVNKRKPSSRLMISQTDLDKFSKGKVSTCKTISGVWIPHLSKTSQKHNLQAKRQEDQLKGDDDQLDKLFSWPNLVLEESFGKRSTKRLLLLPLPLLSLYHSSSNPHIFSLSFRIQAPASTFSPYHFGFNLRRAKGEAKDAKESFLSYLLVIGGVHQVEGAVKDDSLICLSSMVYDEPKAPQRTLPCWAQRPSRASSLVQHRPVGLWVVQVQCV
ncbi:hypothetical protein BVRB_5g107970 [Beta vulgaris subsp. vulgaris]|nr:hypothetical protein BVRB_5g107970 [Beta vulgaris subsp. vulgaris]